MKKYRYKNYLLFRRVVPSEGKYIFDCKDLHNNTFLIVSCDMIQFEKSMSSNGKEYTFDTLLGLKDFILTKNCVIL